MFEKIKNSRLWWLWLIMLFGLVIYMASLAHYRLDLTKEKRFSLNASTKKVMSQLNEPLQIDVFLTGDLSAGFKKLSVATGELLNEFKEYGKGNLNFRFVRPGEGLPDTLKNKVYDSLVAMGIKPFNNEITAKEGEEKTQRLIFPAAMVMFGDRKIPVDLMSGKGGMDEETSLNYSEALLEFKLADAIDKLTRKEVPIVAYAAGNGEPLPPNGVIKDLFVQMSRNYKFGVIDLHTATLDADTINALMIVKPATSFNEVEKLKIDQYIMHGGRVLWFIDKLYAEYDSLARTQSEFVAFDKGLNLDDILFKYGIRINGDLLQDKKSARQQMVVGMVGNQPQMERVPFSYYPLLNAPLDHPISKNLDDVLSLFPGTIDTVKALGIKKTILLASDTLSRTLSTPAMVSLKNIDPQEPLNHFTKSYLPVVVLLEGKFTSLYANRMTAAMQDTLGMFSRHPFLPAGIKDSKQIVSSDADIVTNIVTKTDGALPMGMQQYEYYQFANRDFLMNAVDYLVNPNGVLQSRNKDLTLRLLNRQKIQSQKTMWQLINIVLPILLVLIFGAFYQWRRQQQFGA